MERVQHIGYNAKGQRLIIAYGNSLMTRYTYDTQTFRLKRLRTEGYDYSQSGNEHYYNYKAGTTKQDFAYVYDKAGNILSINNETPQCGVGGTDELDRAFEYDALYRLLFATGRENQPSALYWDDSYRSDDPYSTTEYTQNYSYDLMGNINELAHYGSNNFTRTYTHTNNLLQNFEAGGNTFYYEYDACGNQIKENEERHSQWDYGDKMRLFYNQTNPGNEPSIYTHYLYDASGNRVKKYTRTAGGNWETITYINGLIEYREDQNTNRQSISHVMDDTKRILTQREGYDFGDTTPPIKFNLDDHLGSSNVLVDENGTLVNFEEYYPFGETSFGSYGKKRYRFCGKERDEESGMYYYGARYYSPWLCRFVSVDPKAKKYPFYTPYQYAGNQPINFIDLDGAEQAQAQTPAGGAATPTPSVNNTAGSNAKPPVNLTPSTGDLLNAALKSYSNLSASKPTLSQTINKELKGTQIKTDNVTTKTPAIVNVASSQPQKTTPLPEVKNTIVKPSIASLNNVAPKSTSVISEAWNSDASRAIIADAYSITLSGTAMAGAGWGQSYSLTFITRGPDASIIPYLFSSPEFGPGLDPNVSVGLSTSSFDGPTNEIAAKSFEGGAVNASAGPSLGNVLDLSVNSSIGFDGEQFGPWRTIGFSVGTGIPTPTLMTGHTSVSETTMILSPFNYQKK